MSGPITLAPAAPRSRRYAELGLLLAALVIAGCGYVATDLAITGQWPSGLIPAAIACILVLGAAHLAVRKYAPYADPIILPLAAFLNLMGLVLIHRLDLADAAKAEPSRVNGRQG